MYPSEGIPLPSGSFPGQTSLLGEGRSRAGVQREGADGVLGGKERRVTDTCLACGLACEPLLPSTGRIIGSYHYHWYQTASPFLNDHGWPRRSCHEKASWITCTVMKLHPEQATVTREMSTSDEVGE